LKKAAQKLLFRWAVGTVADSAFASFCSQKEAFLFFFLTGHWS
jgi:hypothetical protein